TYIFIVPTEFLCHISADSYDSKRKIQQHYTRHKQKEKRLPCIYCGYVTYSKGILDRHTIMRHTGWCFAFYLQLKFKFKLLELNKFILMNELSFNVFIINQCSVLYHRN